MKVLVSAVLLLGLGILLYGWLVHGSVYMHCASGEFSSCLSVEERLSGEQDWLGTKNLSAEETP